MDKPHPTAPTLTLHQGGAQAEYAEHPLETARRMLLAAADIETDAWADVLRRFASSLPHHRPVS